MEREKLQPLLMLTAVAVYWFLVIGQMQSAIEGSGASSGSQSKAALEIEDAEMRKVVDAAKQKIDAKEEDLKQELGTLRFTGAANKTPLDALLTAIDECCHELGITLRSVTPSARVKTGVLEQEGLQCRIELTKEEQFSQLVNALREKGRSRNAMTHSFTMSKNGKGVTLNVFFSILRKAVAPNDKVQFADLETWLGIQRERTPYPNGAFLEPRPAVVVATPAPKPVKPTPATTSAMVRKPSPPPPPSVPAFSGRLLGVGSSSNGVEAAILEVGGQQQVVEPGEKLPGGWMLRSVEENQVVMENSGQKVTLFFREEKSGPSEETTTATAAPALKAVAGAPKLGFGGTFETIAPNETPPAPYDVLKRVFVVSTIADGGIADRAGMRSGDRVLAIDHVPLRVSDQLLGLRSKLAQRHVCALEISRNRSILQLALNP